MKRSDEGTGGGMEGIWEKMSKASVKEIIKWKVFPDGSVAKTLHVNAGAQATTSQVTRARPHMTQLKDPA